MVISVLKRKIADEFNKLTTLEEQLEFIVEMGLELSLEENDTTITNHVCFRGVQAMDVKMNPLKCWALSSNDIDKLEWANITIHGVVPPYSSESQINFEI